MAHEYMTCSETGVNLNAESCELYHEAMNAGFTEAAYALYRYYGRYVSGKTGMFRAKKWLNKEMCIRDRVNAGHELVQPDKGQAWFEQCDVIAYQNCRGMAGVCVA